MAAEEPARAVARFDGEARCRRGAGAVSWSVTGVERGSGLPLEVLLCGAPALQLPAQLAGAEVHVAGGAAAPAWQLRSGDRVVPLPVRSVQVHRDAARAFAGALRPAAAPLTARAAWWLLLGLLRVPGVGAWLRRMRQRGEAA